MIKPIFMDMLTFKSRLPCVLEETFKPHALFLTTNGVWKNKLYKIENRSLKIQFFYLSALMT